MQRQFTSDEVKECVAKLKNRKAAGADEIVNEFVKYGGGEGMTTTHDGYAILLGMGKRVHNQEAERRGVVNLFKKGDKADPGNYRGITLLSTKIVNDRVGTMLEKEEKISKGQAGFRPNRRCVHHVYTCLLYTSPSPRDS